MKEITLGKDQVIFRQGDTATVMYDILSGKVGIYVDYETEKQKQIAVLEAGEIFGEMGMIEYYPRSATAVALEETVAAEIGESELQNYFKNKPEKLLKLMKLLSRRIRETTQKYYDVSRSVSEHERAKDAAEKRQRFDELQEYAKLYSRNWMA